MRWDNLFDDLESQLEHGLTAEEVDLRAEEERLRLGRLSVLSRIVAIHEAGREPGRGAGREDATRSIRVVLTDGTMIDVWPVTFGRDWFSGGLLDDSERHPQCVVPVAAVASLVLGREQVAASLRVSDGPGPAPGLSGRLGLGFVLRDLCRRRRSVELHLASGGLYGTIDRVGRDHVDLAVHERGTPRRESAVSHYRLVPLDQILLVRMRA